MLNPFKTFQTCYNTVNPGNRGNFFIAQIVIAVLVKICTDMGTESVIRKIFQTYFNAGGLFSVNGHVFVHIHKNQIHLILIPIPPAIRRFNIFTCPNQLTEHRQC